jgi:hypothetical protein
VFDDPAQAPQDARFLVEMTKNLPGKDIADGAENGGKRLFALR